jgi:hypothetical protein
MVRLNGDFNRGQWVDLKVYWGNSSASLVATDDDGEEVFRLSMTEARLEAVLAQLRDNPKEENADPETST